MDKTPRYRVRKLYDRNGQVAPHFLDDEFHSFCESWDKAMSDPNFAEIIERDLAAERLADDPLDQLAALAPNERVRTRFLKWLEFIDTRLNPWTTGGAIHFRPHWARVLMLALTMGDAAGLSDTDLDALGQPPRCSTIPAARIRIWTPATAIARRTTMRNTVPKRRRTAAARAHCASTRAPTLPCSGTIGTTPTACALSPQQRTETNFPPRHPAGSNARRWKRHPMPSGVCKARSCCCRTV